MADQKVLNVAVVSAERALWTGQATSLVAKTPEGDIGILPGHEPVLALLVESALRIEELDGTKLAVAVHGGFFSVAGDDVNIITEVAELAEDIDIDRAKAALARAQDLGIDDPDGLSAIRRAEARIQTASVAKGVSAR
jgi:F-type H+-transporting ATPase subunit epsilon